MRPLAVESLILTGGQCLTAFGSSDHMFQNLLPIGFMHIKEQIYRRWLTQRCIKITYDTYLLGNEDVLDKYNIPVNFFIFIGLTGIFYLKGQMNQKIEIFFFCRFTFTKH